MAENLLRSLPRAQGASTQMGSMFVAWGCVYTRGNSKLALLAGRFKLSYSCSEVVLQMTCIGDKNKALQARPQTQVSRDTVHLPSPTSCLLQSAALQDLLPGCRCVRGGASPAVAEVSHPSKAPACTRTGHRRGAGRSPRLPQPYIAAPRQK